MVRKYGLAIDNLLSAQVVTADGEIVTASADENPDLFWAIRGGGGNFGIVTEFEFRLAPVGQILGGALVLPATREVLRGYLDYVADAPDDLTTIANLMHAPPAPFIPADRVGELVLMILVVLDRRRRRRRAGVRAAARARGAGRRRGRADAVPGDLPVHRARRSSRTAPRSARCSPTSMSDATFDAILEAMKRASAPMSMVQFRGLGGAHGARRRRTTTAFAHRDRRFFTTVLGLWLDPDDDAQRHWDWTNALWEQIRGEAAGVYVNFLDDEGEERIRDAYPPAHVRAARRGRRRSTTRTTCSASTRTSARDSVIATAQDEEASASNAGASCFSRFCTVLVAPLCLCVSVSRRT